MEQKDLDLQHLAGALLSEIRNYGIKDISCEQYEIVLKRILSFANESGYDNYHSKLREEFDTFIDSKIKDGKFCYGYGRFQHRVIRMLDSMALTGKVDFSATQRNHRMYKVTEKSYAIIQQALDYHNLTGESRVEMDTVMRHFFHYAEKITGSENILVTDKLLMDFFTQELPSTNKGSMGRSLRAIKYLSVYLKSLKRSDLKLDFSQLNARSSHVRVIPPYSQAELKSLIEKIDTSTTVGVRNLAIILLAFDTGLRSVDIRGLCLKDIDWHNGVIQVRQSKTNVPLQLPLSGKVMNAIAEYILNVRPDSRHDEVFLTTKAPYKPLNKRRYGFSNLLDQYASDAGIEKISGRGFHSLRRSFAVELSEAGVSIETISQLLGHKSITEDKPYLSYNREQIAFCAIDFREIPVANGIYAGGDHDENN